MRKRLTLKQLYIGSVLLLLMALALLAAVTYSWFINRRKLSTVTWIKTPNILTIGSGKNHDIRYLDMGDIDVESGNPYKDYVFCVYGTPADNYSLQLAYTTNIAFKYEVYRAVESDTDSGVPSSYIDSNGEIKTEYFVRLNNTPVIIGRTLDELGASASEHQSHQLSYGDDNGLNAIDKAKVQKNAEPLYWLAQENGTSVLAPLNPQTVDGESCSLDYFIIRVSWDPNVVKNDKETDIVYLTASR